MLILSGSYGYPKCDWQIFSVYGFASGSNSKCARFFSKRFTPGTGGVDFFMQELSSEDFFWLFPPVNLLCKTVEHLALFRASGVLLLPVWPKSSFFSYFFPEGRHLPEWVSAVVPVKPTFVAGPLVTSKFFRSVGSWDCLLIQVDFGGFDFSRFFFPSWSTLIVF